MDNFDLIKYLAEGRLLKEGKYTEFVDDRENEYMDFNYSAIEMDLEKYGKTANDLEDFLDTRDVDVEPTDEEIENWFSPNEKINQYIKNGSKGNLRLNFTPITSLPDNFKVEGDLYLYGTKITSLPYNLQVGGDLDLRDTPISEKYSEEEIEKMVPGVKGDILAWKISK